MPCPDCAALRFYRAASRGALSSLTYAIDHSLRCVIIEGDAELRRIGMTRERFLGRPLADFMSPENLEVATAAIRAALHGRPSTLSLMRGDRSFVVQYAPALDDSDAIIGCTVIARDVTDIVEVERAASRLEVARLQDISLHDELTRALNRRGFLACAGVLLESCAREGRPALVFFADINGMKAVNDSLGHDVGDEAIKALAAQLRRTFRDGDVVGRLGGDEFVVFAPDAPPSAAETFRLRLVSNVAIYNASSSARPFRLSVSLGSVAFDPARPVALDALLVAADGAMYSAKRRRKASGSSSEMPAVRGR